MCWPWWSSCWRVRALIEWCNVHVCRGMGEIAADAGGVPAGLAVVSSRANCMHVVLVAAVACEQAQLNAC